MIFSAFQQPIRVKDGYLPLRSTQTPAKERENHKYLTILHTSICNIDCNKNVHSF